MVRAADATAGLIAGQLQLDVLVIGHLSLATCFAARFIAKGSGFFV
jgi:hypothetical protein